MSDYIQTMRNLIGHQTLLTVGCGAIIEDENGRILLQQRTDRQEWGIPGGLLELGETFEETVKREVYEETGLSVEDLNLFGIYSGKKGFAEYENGDRVYSVQVIFVTKKFSGQIKQNEESKRVVFLEKHNLPNKFNPHQLPFIKDWIQGAKAPVIK
ncbi:NUDIX domain-containing protein [Bacillus sp. FSL H8-0547]